ncbi:MAG: DUF4824 family protein [Burkholderiales bacterium]
MTLTWSRNRTLAAGAALVVVTNAIALGGVAWNRSGTPESELKLTQRELHDTYGLRYDREAGGTELGLRWRMHTSESDDLFYYDSFGGGMPDWLDEAKLAALGFDVSKQPDARRESRRYARLLPKEALIVLELDGPATRAALQRARERLAKETAKEAAETGKTDRRSQVKLAAESLKREETSSSRLFAVDAGTDVAALRAKYPDRGRYAIVRGKVRAYPPAASGRAQERRWRGYIESIDTPRVNVPLEFRRQAGMALRAIPRAGPTDPGPRYEVTVAFGQRLEPWVTAVSVTK